MAVGFGIDRDANGNGTTPEDIQKIIGSIWNMEGIIFGGAVDTVASEMAYQITPGSVLINMGDQRRIIAPFDRIKVPTDPNPGTSTRRDKVYVKQNLSSSDGSNLVEIKVTQGSLPARSILLADYEVPAGATTTAGAVDRANRVFARSVGGSYGQVAKSVDKDTRVRSTGVFKMGQQQLFFGTQWHGVAPGDRDCTLHFVSNVSSGRGSDGVPVDEVGTVLYTFYLNGTKLCRFERKFDAYRTEQHFAYPFVIQKPPNGQGHVHQIYYTLERKAYDSKGKGTYQVNYGGSEGYAGDCMWIVDQGMANL